MHIHMNLDGVDVAASTEKLAETTNRPSFRTLISGALSLGLGLVVVIVGLMAGLTLMLILLGLLPIALLWFWYATRRTSYTMNSVVASVDACAEQGETNAQSANTDSSDARAETGESTHNNEDAQR